MILPPLVFPEECIYFSLHCSKSNITVAVSSISIFYVNMAGVNCMLQSLALKERTSIRLKLRLSEDATTICRTPIHPLTTDQNISFKNFCAALLLQQSKDGGRHDIPHNEIKQNDIQNMNIQHNITQHKQ